MSISSGVAEHIPYLRRFARALTGSREGGDAYVLATLETLVADPRKVAGASEPREALYRLFLQVWSAAPINDHTDRAGAPGEAGARRNLDAIPVKPRVAFLLTALEGFDAAQTARVLDTTIDGVDAGGGGEAAEAEEEEEEPSPWPPSPPLPLRNSSHGRSPPIALTTLTALAIPSSWKP